MVSVRIGAGGTGSAPWRYPSHRKKRTQRKLRTIDPIKPRSPRHVFHFMRDDNWARWLVAVVPACGGAGELWVQEQPDSTACSSLGCRQNETLS